MATLDIRFQKPDGAEEVKTFETRPLGVEFVRRMPLTVSESRSASMQLGVQKGWVVKEIGGENIENMDYNAAFQVFKQAVVPLKPEFVRRDSVVSATSCTSVAEMCAAVGPVPVGEVPDFLKRHGYVADTPSTWEKGAERPNLLLSVVADRSEKAGLTSATWYTIHGSLDAQGQHLCWEVERRLSHLRALLHDPLKEELGPAYDRIYEDAHFAGRTTSKSAAMPKLEAWFSALAKAANSGRLPPKQLARTLRFLEAPELASGAAPLAAEATAVAAAAPEGPPEQRGWDLGSIISV